MTTFPHNAASADGTPAQPALACSGLTKRYGGKTALNGLTLTIPAGSVAGILGPNGCGKSTLFRVLTGLVAPESGSVSVLGQTPGWQANAGIAYLPDRARWYPGDTVRQAFRYGESFLPGFDTAEAERLAGFMAIDPGMRIGGMSRGQEARVLLILCMARNVPLVILDEPFAGIDVLSREAIVAGMIEYLEDRRQTILISTHDIAEVEALFDYTVLMENGAAAWSGDSEELRAQHGSLRDVFRSIYRKEGR